MDYLLQITSHYCSCHPRGRRVSGLPKEALYARCVADVQPRCPEANARGATIRIERIADKENRCFCEPIELGIARQYLVVPLINLERPPARRGDQSVLEKRKVKIRDAHLQPRLCGRRKRELASDRRRRRIFLEWLLKLGA
jgi:hypothetical protein